MKRRNLLIAIAAILVMFAFVACSESIAPEDRLGTITFGENSSRAVGTVVKYSNEVEDMIWFYEATKLDDGYTTGQTTGFVAVAEATEKAGDNTTTTYEATAGLSGQTLNNNFSYGLWNIVLEGYKKANVEVSSEGNVTIKTGASAEYKATITNFLVDKGANYAKAEIQLGDNPTTEIVFDADKGISFESGNITANSKFTLAVTDTKGTVAVATLDGVNDVNVEKGKVTFYDLTYTPETGVDISGEHTMNFVLSQTLSGTDNTTIEAALYTLKFTVQAGTTTTISGTLVKNDVTGTVQINSVQDVPKLTVNRVLEVKDIDSSKSVATITSDRTIKYGDMEVTYPAGAKIATTADTLSVDEGENTGTSDAEIGFVYKDATAPTDNEGQTITIAEANSSEKYELTLSASTADTGDAKNTVLLTIKKNIGANREISAVYHEKTSLAKYSDLTTDDAKAKTESYEYAKSTGVLTLRLFHASDIFIISKEYVAEADGTKYYSLSDAITKVEAGGTVTLLRSVTLSETETITVSKSITLDMARRAISGDGKITVGVGGVVTVQNSSPEQASEFISADVKIGSSAEINAKYYPALDKAVAAAVSGDTLVLLRDTTLSDELDINTSMAIDFNQKKLSFDFTSKSCNGIWIGQIKNTKTNPTLVFKNGSIDGKVGSHVVISALSGTLKIEKMGLTLHSNSLGGMYIPGSYDENISSDAVNLEIVDSTINFTTYGTGWAAICDQSDATSFGSLRIVNSTINDNTEYVQTYAIKLNRDNVTSYGDIEINNSTIKGHTIGFAIHEAPATQKVTITDSTISGDSYGAMLCGGDYTIIDSSFKGTETCDLLIESDKYKIAVDINNAKMMSKGLLISVGSSVDASYVTLLGTLKTDSVTSMTDKSGKYEIVTENDVPTIKAKTVAEGDT